MKSRDVHDIAYWMVDDDYDGANFIISQCGEETTKVLSVGEYFKSGAKGVPENYKAGESNAGKKAKK